MESTCEAVGRRLSCETVWGVPERIGGGTTIFPLRDRERGPPKSLKSEEKDSDRRKKETA